MKGQDFSGKSTRVVVCISMFVALLMAQSTLARAVDAPLVVYRLAGLPACRLASGNHVRIRF